MLTFSDGTAVNLDRVVGAKGDKGDQGEQGIQGEKGDRGEQGIQGEKGETGAAGRDGIDGTNGINGTDGIGIADVTINTSDELVLTFSDGRNINLGNVKGSKGDKGDRGEQGIQGEKGDQGEQGVQGAKGDKGDKGDQGEQGVQGVQGEKGDKGDKGDAGRGIAKTELVNGELIITYTDGTSDNLGKIGSTEDNADNKYLIFSLLDDNTYGVALDSNYTNSIIDKITIPENYNGLPVTKIMDSAFESSKIKEISIPSTVTYIGNKAFYQCTYLENINDFSEMTGLETIGNSAFAGCGKITISNLALPENVSVIGDFAFSGVNVECVVIPESVQGIGRMPFSDTLKQAEVKGGSWTRKTDRYDRDDKIISIDSSIDFSFSASNLVLNAKNLSYYEQKIISNSNYNFCYRFTRK